MISLHWWCLPIDLFYFVPFCCFGTEPGARRGRGRGSVPLLLVTVSVGQWRAGSEAGAATGGEAGRKHFKWFKSYL